MVTPVRLGRYELHDELATGGMASVHLGRLYGGAGFSRVVAIKRLHPQYAKDPDFAEMFLDEAKLASCVRHPNVVPITDVVAADDELFLVMEYVPGRTAAQLRRALGRATPIPIPIALRLAIDALAGLHAVHRATDEAGNPLEIVHRDVSPDNLLVGSDGVTRVIDFGVARGHGRIHKTRTGVMKGKVSYASPEQILGEPLDCRTDVYSMGMTLWRLLAGVLPFEATDEIAVMHSKVTTDAPRLGSRVDVPPAIDEVVFRATQRKRAERFETARSMAEALRAAAPELASPYVVAEWLAEVASGALRERADRVTQILEMPAVTDTSQTIPVTTRPVSGPAAVALALALAGGIAAYVFGVRPLARPVAVPEAISYLATHPIPTVAEPAAASSAAPAVTASASARAESLGREGSAPPTPPAEAMRSSSLRSSEPPRRPPPPAGRPTRKDVPDRLLGRQ